MPFIVEENSVKCIKHVEMVSNRLMVSVVYVISVF